MEAVKFSELKVGMKGTYTKKITQEDVDNFINICNDVNRLHVNEEFAKNNK